MTITLPQILTMARTGSPARAWSVFVSAGWDQIADDPKALTLKGRLLKDRAKSATPDIQAGLYHQAAQAYASAASLGTDSYPLINAATLSLLSGDAQKAAEQAAQTLELIDNNPGEGENAYWRGATRAEALLLMDDEAEAQLTLSQAMALLPYAWEDHAATISQFALILEAQGRNSEWLDAMRPPSSVHFSGIIHIADGADGTGAAQRAIEAFLHTERPGFAYGALAAGADLIFAKAFLDYRKMHNPYAELHVILPYPEQEFRSLSIAPFGAQWLTDFDDVMAAADTVTMLGLDDPPGALAITMADSFAMGKAMRNACNLQSRAKAITVTGYNEPLRPHLADWCDNGQELQVITAQKSPPSQAPIIADPANPAALQILLWANNIDAGTLSDMAQRHKDADTQHSFISGEFQGGHWIMLRDLKHGYSAAADIAANASNNTHIAMLYSITANDSPQNNNPHADLLARAKHFASAAQPEVIASDGNIAMALTLIKCAQSIEEIGELRTLWGPQPLWRII